MTRTYLMAFDADSMRSLAPTGDVFMQLHVPRELMAHETGLFQSKWFDYRRMTPVEATCEYIRHYGETYRWIYRREIDCERAQYVQPMSAEKLNAGLAAGSTQAKRFLSGFWRGRQVADAIGMPYEIYLEHAFKYRMRNWSRAHLPQPTQLYHEYDVEKIVERWEELQDARLYLPEDPAYLVQNYRDIPYQNDFHEYLFRQAARRGNDPEILAELVNRDLLPIDKLATRLEPGDYARVETYLQ